MAGNTQTLTTRLVVDDQASQPTSKYADLIEGLDNETATVVLALKAGQVQTDLEQILADIATLDQSDPSISVKLEQAAQAKQELDDLEAQIKSLNDTPVDIDTKPATTGVKDLGTEADNSRSVLANMVGNSAQDLGELGGVAGTAGLAVGQLAEYAADGQINLAGLAKVAGPMAALGVAMWAVSRGAEQAAKRTKDIAEAIDDLGRASDAEVLRSFDEMLRDTLLNGGDFHALFEQMASDQLEGTKRLLDLAEASGQYGKATDELRAAIEEEERSRAQAKKTTDEYGDSADEATDATDANTESLKRNKSTLDEAERSAREYSTALQGLRGDLDFDQTALNFQTAMTEAQTKVREGVGLSKQDILDLKQNYLDTAEKIGLTPVQIKSDLKKIDQGDIDSVFWTTQQAIDKKGAATITVKPSLALDAMQAELRRLGVTPTGVNKTSASSAPQIVNVNLPRGARAGDIARAMSAHTRRAGRRYQMGTVAYARR